MAAERTWPAACLLGGLLRLVLGDTATGAADLLLPVLRLLDLLARGLLLVLKQKRPKTRPQQRACEDVRKIGTIASKFC